MRVVRALAAGVLAMSVLAGAAACGGSGDGDGGGAGGPGEPEIGILDPSLDPDAGMAPEDVRLAAAEVAAGLRVVKDLAQSATAALGPNDLDLLPEQAATLQADIAPSWSLVSPTVRERDAATATALEEAFPAFGAAIGAMDQGAARTASDRIAAAVDAYIAKFPPDAEPVEMPEEDGGEDGGEGEGDGSMPEFTPAPEPVPSETPEP